MIWLRVATSRLEMTTPAHQSCCSKGNTPGLASNANASKWTIEAMIVTPKRWQVIKYMSQLSSRKDEWKGTRFRRILPFASRRRPSSTQLSYSISSLYDSVRNACCVVRNFTCCRTKTWWSQCFGHWLGAITVAWRTLFSTHVSCRQSQMPSCMIELPLGTCRRDCSRRKSDNDKVG